jgi:nitroreductase
MNAIFERRSTRSFSKKKVEAEKLARILDAGNFAPSAMNNQDRQFTVIENEDVLLSLNEAVKNSANAETVKRINERTENRFSFFYKAPVLVVVSHLPGAIAPEADSACSLQNMFLEAHDLGLGSCWINQLNSLCDVPSVREILTRIGIPEEHKVYGCAAIGYIAKETPLHEKKSKIVFCK